MISASVVIDTAAKLVLVYTNSKKLTSQVTRKGMVNNIVKYLFLLSTTILSIMVLAQSYHADKIDYLKTTTEGDKLNNFDKTNGPLKHTIGDDFLIVSHQSEHADMWKFYSDACHIVTDDYSLVNNVIDWSMWLVTIGASISLVCNMIQDIYIMMKGPPKVGQTPTFSQNSRDISMLTVSKAIAIMGDFLFNVFGVLFVILVIFPFTYINCPAYNMIIKNNRYYVTYSIVFTLLIFSRMGYFMVGQWK